MFLLESPADDARRALRGGKSVRVIKAGGYIVASRLGIGDESAGWHVIEFKGRKVVYESGAVADPDVAFDLLVWRKGA